MMHCEAFKTPLVQPRDTLKSVLIHNLPLISEKDIIVITSKIISLCQNRVVPYAIAPSKPKLIAQEANAIADISDAPHGACYTLKDGLLILSAGIDESNAQEGYILYPQDCQKVAYDIWKLLRTHYNLKKVGVLITDSRTTPFRRGVTGVGLGWCGFEPIHSCIGDPDLFGKPLKVTSVNVVDALASAAVFVMGEGAEQTPLARIQNAPKVTFLSDLSEPQEREKVVVSLKDDLYAPLFKGVTWRKGMAQ